LVPVLVLIEAVVGGEKVQELCFDLLGIEFVTEDDVVVDLSQR